MDTNFTNRGLGQETLRTAIQLTGGPPDLLAKDFSGG